MPAKKEVAVEAPPSAEEKQARQQLAKAESALQDGDLEEATTSLAKINLAADKQAVFAEMAGGTAVAILFFFLLSAKPSCR